VGSLDESLTIGTPGSTAPFLSSRSAGFGRFTFDFSFDLLADSEQILTVGYRMQSDQYESDADEFSEHHHFFWGGYPYVPGLGGTDNYLLPDGGLVSDYADGSREYVMKDGTRVLRLKNGKRRVIHPDGTVVWLSGDEKDPDDGFTWFFSESNVASLTKILGGDSTEGHFWVFSGSLTNVEYELTVTDTETVVSKTYLPMGGEE